MLVPAAVEELHEAHAALEEAPAEQAVRGVAAWAAHLGSVEFERLGLLVGDVRELGHRRLHAERHLVGLDARERLGVACGRRVHRVQLDEIVKLRAPRVAVDAVGVREVRHGVAARAEADALVRRRQEAAAPEAREDRLPRILARALRNEHDESRQIRVLAAEAVARPRAHARVAGQLVARVHEGDRGIVVDRLGGHALDDAEVVGDRLDVRQEIADPEA